jgi:pimeloyl-ACP methyl ester carboxylesterase
LLRTRWPDEEPVANWSQGVPLAYLRELCDYWATGYDWRATERLNALPQYRMEIDGIGIHFLHVRSPHEQALPLILTHGWPGSVLEFEKAIAPLTEPDDPADTFHVVIPSLPGYGFSDRPTEPGWRVQRIAAAWRELMARLGYERYGAQGSDWGTSVTTSMGQQDTGQLAGIHVMPPIAAPDPATFDDLTRAEEAALADLRHSAAHESGYAEQMTTKPQTVGYALTDSRPGCARGSSKSSLRGATAAADRRPCSPVTRCWMTSRSTGSRAQRRRPHVCTGRASVR